MTADSASSQSHGKCATPRVRAAAAEAPRPKSSRRKRQCHSWLAAFLSLGEFVEHDVHRTRHGLQADHRGITTAFLGTNPIKAILDPYNPVGSTNHVRFNTLKKDRWETSSQRCHINWVILDSDWEAEFCRVAEAHPKVFAYMKNHNLGFEVPYRYGSESRIYRPDFIVLVDDGHGTDDLLRVVVEIKGYRGEDAKEKKATMDTYWVPGVNNLGTFGRWAFAEFTEVYQIEADFKAKVESEFNKMIETAGSPNASTITAGSIMKSETIQLLTGTFEAHAQQTEGGVEYWLGRDLQHLLGYTEWRNFTAVIGKAKTACEVSGHPAADHFVEVNKMIDLRWADSVKSTTSCSPATPATSSPKMATPKSRKLLSPRPISPSRLAGRN